MIVVYGDSAGCFTCAVLKHLLSKSGKKHRFYELDKDFTMDDFATLLDGDVSLLPVIFIDGREATLPELERELIDKS